MLRRGLAPALALLAAPAAAGDIALALPVDCPDGLSCHVRQYVDHAPGPDAKDFACNGLTYDGHKGTDFGLPSQLAMQRGVDVLAAAPGTVKAVRDGMPDIAYTADRAAEVDGRDCGNGVVIDHGGGWETQYCHLRQGSVRATPGQPVDRGEVLGRVGLSGRTQFPHVHLSVRRDGAVVDPFVPEGRMGCSADPEDTLWQAAPPYVPGAMLNAGFADTVPAYADVKSGAAAAGALDARARALVIWGFAFGGRQGDVMALSITGPEGEVIRHDARLEKDQAQFFRAAGRRLTAPRWPAGRYEGRAALERAGRVIDTLTTTIEIR
ncbi:M23 family metallopeptidase [Roseovarius salinarum]|uniref:M23 family metallopeptidase n=1 Tax=Roseovarius salinarum TaxID=1981892 RepID=UPI000C322199|nr:M23 family metallopeptidase [Roseovarius salinarum]